MFSNKFDFYFSKNNRCLSYKNEFITKIMFQREFQGICRSTHGSMLNACELWCLTLVIADKDSSISVWQLYMTLRLAKQATTTAK